MSPVDILLLLGGACGLLGWYMQRRIGRSGPVVLDTMVSFPCRIAGQTVEMVPTNITWDSHGSITVSLEDRPTVESRYRWTP